MGRKKGDCTEARPLMRRITPEWIHQKSMWLLASPDHWKVKNDPHPFSSKSPTRIYIYYASPFYKRKFIYWGQPANWMKETLCRIDDDRHRLTNILLAEWDKEDYVMLLSRNYIVGRDGPTFIHPILFGFYHPQYKGNLNFPLVWGDLAQYKWKRFEDKYRFSPVLSVQKREGEDYHP